MHAGTSTARPEAADGGGRYSGQVTRCRRCCQPAGCCLLTQRGPRVPAAGLRQRFCARAPRSTRRCNRSRQRFTRPHRAERCVPARQMAADLLGPGGGSRGSRRQGGRRGRRPSARHLSGPPRAMRRESGPSVTGIDRHRAPARGPRPRRQSAREAVEEVEGIGERRYAGTAGSAPGYPWRLQRSPGRSAPMATSASPRSPVPGSGSSAVPGPCTANRILMARLPLPDGGEAGARSLKVALSMPDG